MSESYFISDLHLGHRKILDFSPLRLGMPCFSVEEHDQIIIDRINSVVTKRDQLWVLGDVAFCKEAYKLLDTIKCPMYLVRGNHDQFKLEDYTRIFKDVHGIVKKYGFWLSHAPVHQDELRGHYNIHGHVHQKSILDSEGDIDCRYLNVCIETTHGYPMSLMGARNFVKEMRDECI